MFTYIYKNQNLTAISVEAVWRERIVNTSDPEKDDAKPHRLFFARL